MATGLQREILGLYRQCLRACRKKPPEARASMAAYTRAEFRKFKDVSKKDFQTIEFLKRRGERRLEEWGGSDIKGFKF